MNIINFNVPSIGGLSAVIKWLIQISSSIAVGVILFTVILKLITLPFDFFSRASMRKNALKMEAMRPELEKLQKQYANDKTKYNQKMMALYKKNGYSMWGACLPTIITLVIFIVAINSFTSYSNYQNRKYFYDMSVAYNNAIYAGLETDGDLIKLENGTYKIEYENIYNGYNDDINVKNTVGDMTEQTYVEKSDVDNKNDKIITKTYNRTYFLGQIKKSNDSGFETILNCYKKTKIKSNTPYTGEGNNIDLGTEVFDDTSEEVKNYQMSIETTNGYIKYTFSFRLTGDENKFKLDSEEIFEIINDKLINNTAIASEYNNNLKVTYGDTEYGFGDEYKAIAAKGYITNYKNVEIKDYNENLDSKEKEKNVRKFSLEDITEYNKKVDEYNAKNSDKKKYLLDSNSEDAINSVLSEIDEKYFLSEICQERSAETFRNIGTGFLWVKNIWVTDSPMSHPIASSWSSFKSTYKYSSSDSDNMDEYNYNQLIAKLTTEQSQPNGYFILAILTAGISFLTQFVMSKAQKAQMELQTVDGQGAKTQKIMMWVMPIMMAFFAFMYTAAFSIYMILSSVISILTTLGINWIVGKKYAKKVKEGENDKIRGRVYVPEVEEPKKLTKQEKKELKIKEKNKNKPKDDGKDFIKGEKTHIRGRLK